MILYWLCAFLCPAFFALGNLIDNHVLHARLRDPVSYDILTIWPLVSVAALIFLLTPVSFGFDAVVVGGSVGLASAFLSIVYCVAMMREQGTNVVSIAYTNPLYVAVFASVFLGESLTLANYIGIVLLVGSATLVLYRRVSMRNLTLGIVLAYAVALATTRVVAKAALGGVDVWSYLLWFIVGQCLGTVVLVAFRRKNFSESWHKLDSRLVLLILATTFLSFTGLVFLYSAFSLGSVTLASGMAAIQPSVLLVYSTVASKFHPEAFPPETIKGRWVNLRKVGAVILIVLGALALIGT